MPNTTKIFSPEQIAYLVENVKKAHAIKTDSIDFERIKENPAFKALSEIEQTAYLMYLGGMLHKDIAETLGIERSRVTKLLNIVKGKIRFLFYFRTELLNDPEYLRKFYLKKDDLKLFV